MEIFTWTWGMKFQLSSEQVEITFWLPHLELSRLCRLFLGSFVFVTWLISVVLTHFWLLCRSIFLNPLWVIIIGITKGTWDGVWWYLLELWTLLVGKCWTPTDEECETTFCSQRLNSVNRAPKHTQKSLPIHLTDCTWPPNTEITGDIITSSDGEPW